MKQYDYKTISRTMLGDLHTPVSTYLKVRDIFPQSALMESSDYHGSENNVSEGARHLSAERTYGEIRLSWQ